MNKAQDSKNHKKRVKLTSVYSTSEIGKLADLDRRQTSYLRLAITKKINLFEERDIEAVHSIIQVIEDETQALIEVLKKNLK